MKYLLMAISMVAFVCVINGQSYWFGAKGGLGYNNQSWGNGGTGVSFNRNPLFSFNGDIFVETYDELKKGALYAQFGYHTRGSGLRIFNQFSAFNTVAKYKFNNLVLELGAKKSLNLGKEVDPYFILGVRGEYTVSNNLGNFNSLVSIVDPQFVRKFNYGVTIGGGFEMQMSELSNVFLEFSVQPDFSFQYEQFPIDNILSPWGTNEYITLPLTQVKNLSIEAKVGVKFLRKVEYID
ncbi:MAG: hypothetical protein U0T36_01035 [Saprospiraceae bacterium]